MARSTAAVEQGMAATDVAAPVADFLRLMADPTRRRIFLQLMRGELCNCEMVSVLGLPQNLISHHLRLLHAAGLVRSRRDPDDQRWVYYSVAEETLASALAALLDAFNPAHIGCREPECAPAKGGR
jgi:DNA-binding transcriptional ArsR family regulator